MNESSQDLRSELEDKEYAHGYFEEHLNEYIATQIKVLREQRGWTQGKLAEESGMAQERISVLEDVSYSSWTVNTLRKLAWAFDLRLHVSFETFSSGIEQIRLFGADFLRRDSREKDLGFIPSQELPASNAALNATYEWATNANGAGLVKIRSRTIPEPDRKAPDINETSINTQRASDLAISPRRSQSAWEGVAEKRAA